MDNLLNFFTPAGFEKACQAMVISGAKDLVFDVSHSWKNITSKQVNEIKVEEVKWTEQQLNLRDLGCTDAYTVALERQSKMTTLIEKLKGHGGPLNSEEEIDQFLEIQKEKKVSDKQLASMLNNEIRFRREANLRYALTKNCYLYKQRKISNDERIRNLRILVQRPDGRSTATLDDLRHVYAKMMEGVSDNDVDIEDEIQTGGNKNQVDNRTGDNIQKCPTLPSMVLNGPWPPQIYEHVAVKTEQAWKVGEVVELRGGDKVLLRLFKKVDLTGYEEFSQPLARC